MENFSEPVPDDNDQQSLTPVGLSGREMDIMWKMGVASFPSTNNMLVIPSSMAIKLSKDNVDDLHSRFKAHFGIAQAVATHHPSANVFLIHQPLEPGAAEFGPPDMSSSPAPSTSSMSMMSTPSPASDPARARSTKALAAKSLRLPGKKSRVPRPPNAFILYRAKNHPIVKKANPEMANNDISVILGKKWRAESEQVRTHFKQLAETIKARHALENPGYQYSPRKPSEKKRRMTPRKLAALRTARVKNNSESVSDLEMTDANDVGESKGRNSKAADNSSVLNDTVADFYHVNEPISAAGLMGSERTFYPSRIHHGDQGEMTVVLPAGHGSLEYDYAVRMSHFQHIRPEDEMAVGGRTEASEWDEPPYTRATWAALASDEYMNALIDWDAIASRDALVVQNAGRAEQELPALESLHFANQEEYAQFLEQIHRALEVME
ncbi:hypothetical protein AYL99_11839 [Fonsecaea erecta]|uniref:HMG box domain-containing protein n=1 Tax=Fonsecaea erecta TaxID=1367422 RepID=A0A178Z2D8_9EURO|nr:hypothetical protein AYL99_11839 [Fonsecaea erecta]OAP53959.1 hypothetical protein AYL99_11839 [Fonsecaea erecta]